MAPQELATLLRQKPQYKFVALDYIATAAKAAHQLTVGYKTAVTEHRGRYYAVGNTAQRLPRQVRLLLFGDSHWEIDICGAHYELMRRHCQTCGVHCDLLPIGQTRAQLHASLSRHIDGADLDQLVKAWPLVVINSATPNEGIAYLGNRLQRDPAPDLVCLAREIYAASRYTMNHPPAWRPSMEARSGRSAPFHFFEVIAQHVAWEAFSFLQTQIGFHSAIWLHDGF